MQNSLKLKAKLLEFSFPEELFSRNIFNILALIHQSIEITEQRLRKFNLSPDALLDSIWFFFFKETHMKSYQIVDWGKPLEDNNNLPEKNDVLHNLNPPSNLQSSII